jgi:hypothetical protein
VDLFLRLAAERSTPDAGAAVKPELEAQWP